jgi:hypothetical protein
MLKNESARNATKPVPLRPSRLPDSSGIIFMSNGVRMEKISRSVRKAKQAKFWDADCTCPYSPYRHVSVRTVLTWQGRTTDVDKPDCDTWQTERTTRGSIRERHVAGPYGGHVASPGRDTCQVNLAFSGYSWTNVEVTRVTTHSVTRGTLTSAW